MEAAAGFSATAWRERDILTGASWEESSAATGYLYQILVRLIDKSGNKVTLDDRKKRYRYRGTAREDIRVFLKLCVDGKEVESTCVLPGGR